MSNYTTGTTIIQLLGGPGHRATRTPREHYPQRPGETTTNAERGHYSCTTWSAWRITSGSCVAQTTVWLSLLAAPASSSATAPALASSSLDVGSSTIRS